MKKTDVLAHEKLVRIAGKKLFIQFQIGTESYYIDQTDVVEFVANKPVKIIKSFGSWHLGQVTIRNSNLEVLVADSMSSSIGNVTENMIMVINHRGNYTGVLVYRTVDVVCGAMLSDDTILIKKGDEEITFDTGQYFITDQVFPQIV